MGKNVTVTISPTGKVKVEANGFNGVGCAEATAQLEKALAGGSGFDRVLKPDWYNTEDATEVEQERNW